jgi:hypothetical protein
MLFALSAASSLLDGLQSLTSTASSSRSAAPSSGQGDNPFDVSPAAGAAASSDPATPTGYGTQISPETMSALIDAQSQTGASTSTSLDPSKALQDLFSQIDADGNGQISKSEFENALGAGGTNVAMADDVFNKLDSNGDGSVSLDEMKSALQGAGRHHGHHHMPDIGQAGGTDGGSDSDPLMQALDGASSSSVTNGDGSTTTTITYADGSKVTLTMPASSTGTSTGSSQSSAATSSYNRIEQMIQREAQALSAQAASTVSVSA